MPETTGWVMFPRGVASAVAMMIVGHLINRYQPRLFIIAGVLLTAISTWIMTSYSLYISPAWIIYPGIIRGIGMGMIFVPLTVIAFDTLPIAVSAEASGIFKLARTLGNSMTSFSGSPSSSFACYPWHCSSLGVFFQQVDVEASGGWG